MIPRVAKVVRVQTLLTDLPQEITDGGRLGRLRGQSIHMIPRRVHQVRGLRILLQVDDVRPCCVTAIADGQLAKQIRVVVALPPKDGRKDLIGQQIEVDGRRDTEAAPYRRVQLSKQARRVISRYRLAGQGHADGEVGGIGA